MDIETDQSAAAEPEAVRAPEAVAPAYAVLTRPAGELIEGQVVFGQHADDLADAIAADRARPATPAEVAAAFPFHFPLPEA